MVHASILWTIILMHAQAPIVWYYKELEKIVHISAVQSDTLEKCAPEGRIVTAGVIRTLYLI